MLLAISSRVFYKPASSQFIWPPWSAQPSGTYSYFQEAWMSQKKKMINQLAEIWKLEESHPVSKPQSCGTTATGNLGDFHSWKHLAGSLGSSDPAAETEQTERGDLPLTISYVCCLWLFTLTWQNQSHSPWDLGLWKWLRKFSVLFPPSECHSQSLASLLCRVGLKLEVYVQQLTRSLAGRRQVPVVGQAGLPTLRADGSPLLFRSDNR